jgi:hypothetical protein
MNWFKKIWYRLNQESIEEVGCSTHQALMTGILTSGDAYVVVFTRIPDNIGILTATEENELMDTIDNYFARLSQR